MKKALYTIISLLATTTIMAQTYTLPYTQDFENAQFLPTGWQAFGSNGSGAWEHSDTIGAYGNSNGCAFFDNFTVNLAGNYYGMRAVPLDLTSAVQPMLRFDVAYARRNSGSSDRLGIWYSYNGSTGWNNIINYQHTTLITASEHTNYFVPENTEWDSVTVDLSSFAGTPYVRFAFENNSANGNVLYIDNVRFYDAFSTTGTAPSEDLSQVRVFPNPAMAGTDIAIEYPAPVDRIVLYDLQGKMIADRNIVTGSTQFIYNLPVVPGGIYMLQLFSGQEVSTSRLAIQ